MATKQVECHSGAFYGERPTAFHWEGTLKIAWIKKTITLDGEILGEEQVSVPAGTFTCVKIHFHEKRGDESIDSYAWYAPGTGQVKYMGGTYIKELIEYTVP